MKPTVTDEDAPWFRIVVARSDGDTIVRGLAEEAAGAFRALGGAVVVTEDADLTPPPDGLLVVAAEGANVAAVAAAAPRLAGRAVALAVVAGDRSEASAIAHTLRAAFRTAKALVVPRQLVIERGALGVYGLEDETAREKLEGIVDLLVHESDRLLAKRTGWEEADARDVKEWLGPHVRERLEGDEE